MSEAFSDEFLLKLAGSIAQYMGQEPWIAREHANGAACVEPHRPDFGFHVRNTWPRGRVAIDGLCIRHRDGPYDQSWYYRDSEITVDATRPPERLAADIKRRLLPVMQPRYLEICAQRATMLEQIAQCRKARAWLNGLRNTFDPARDEWEEREFPYYGSHEKYLHVGRREFKFCFHGGTLNKVEVGGDESFAMAVIGLHLATLPPLWGYWRKWNLESNEPYRYWGRVRDEAGEIRAATEAEAESEIEWLWEHFVKQYDWLYKLQFRKLGEERWHDFAITLV